MTRFGLQVLNAGIPPHIQFIPLSGKKELVMKNSQQSSLKDYSNKQVPEHLDNGSISN